MTVRGTIGYYTADGVQTGREDFSIEPCADGGRRLRATCAMEDRALVRHCDLTIDGSGHPVAAEVRTAQAGALAGAARYAFDTNGVVAELTNAAGKSRTIEQATAGRPRFFGTHALVNDGWLALLGQDMDCGETRRLTGLLACSLEADGGGPPAIYETEARLTKLGEAMVATPRTPLACQGWSVRYGDYPALRMWLTQPDGLLASMSWEHLDGYYTLDALADDQAMSSPR